MKRFLVIFFSLPTLAFASDPFANHTWYLDNVFLSTKIHSNFQGYDHTLSYTTLDGEKFLSDACKVTATNTLTCMTFATLVNNPSSHSVTLNEEYTYYEKGYQPQASPLTGHWHTSNTHCEYTDLTIPYEIFSATTFYPASESSPYGYENDISFYLAKDIYSNDFYFGRDPEYGYEGFKLHDSNNQEITSMSAIQNVSSLHMKLGYMDEECVYTKI